MGRELEYKYASTEEVQAELLKTYGNFQQIQMETTYYDTPDRLLSAAHITLRLRKENDEVVCTLKTPLPDGSRGEWECSATDIESGITTLLSLGAPDALEKLTAGGVEPVCGARFTRQVTLVPTADGMAELALDHGVLLGGGKQLPLCEVEIEQKSGSDAATAALAAQIAHLYGLSQEPYSKFRRASDLAKGEYHG